MNRTKHVYWLAIIMLTVLLTACGDGGGGGSDAPVDSSGAALTSVTSGVAVDPYIVGAIVEEISSDGKLLQSSSGPTNALGEFTFPQPVTVGSIIRLKSSAKGMHGNAPFEGMLKHKATSVDGNSVVLSPLTTLVANGMSEDEVSRMMAAAGLPGLTIEDIYSDPVAGLETMTSGVNDSILRNLQANMAANSYMAAIGNFNYNGLSSAGSSLQMSAMVGAVQQTLNTALFNQLAAEIGSGFMLGDLIQTAIQLNRTIVSQISEEMSNGGQVPTASRIDQITSDVIMADAVKTAQEVVTVRNGNGGGVTTPPVTDPGTNPVTPPVTDPGNPATGEGLYAAECQGCHGSLQTTRISNRTVAGIQAAVAGDIGGMGSILLTADEIQLIADAFPAPQPPPVQPPVYRNGQAVYDQECADCHKLATHDAAGNIDLAGLGAKMVTKIEGGHMGKSLPTQELNALADFADTFTLPVPPVVPRSSQTVYDENCSGCHKLNGYDAVGNIDLAGKGSLAATKIPTGHGGSVANSRADHPGCLARQLGAGTAAGRRTGRSDRL